MNEFQSAIAKLPRSDNHRPGAPIDIDAMYIVDGHRQALDLDRVLVVGNRGMGKSFWAHALVDPLAKAKIANELRLPELTKARVRIGFNAALGTDGFAPTATMLMAAFRKGFQPKEIFVALLVRAYAERINHTIPSEFESLLAWIRGNAESVAVLTQRADQYEHLDVLVFDALDRLSDDVRVTNKLIKGLLEASLEAMTTRTLRCKIFIRSDQFADHELFAFPDASKLKNQRVELRWSADDLYSLLLFRLNDVPCFQTLVGSTRKRVETIAGEFMGKDRRRGRVWSWLITHLADAKGEISPRTFLTAWREAAAKAKDDLVSPRAVEPASLAAGVRVASEDRLSELEEDYPWVNTLLNPLRGKAVPMSKTALEAIWDQQNVSLKVDSPSKSIWISTSEGASKNEQLISALVLIGVAEERANQKINVPDIFRVHAGIKRLGGVPPKARTAT